MQNRSYIVVVAALAGCLGKTIDAGSNDTQVAPGGGPTTIASLIQQPPTRIASDGTTLFWSDGSNVSSMPVGGGTIRVLTAGYLLSVDDAGVYVDETDGIYRLPKGGGAQVRISDESAGDTLIGRTTTFGDRAYWAEWQTNVDPSATQQPVIVKTAPLAGGAISTIGQFEMANPNGLGSMAVTASTVFIAVDADLASLSTSAGEPDGGMLRTLPLMQGCEALLSDDDGVYCYPGLGPITRIANDGTTTTVGMTIGGDGSLTGIGLALDDTDAFWIDQTTVGTVMKAPKLGGTATTLARDTQPVAIAVDSTSVYWSDVDGNILRVPK